jgi:hypothetical protein
MAPYPSTRTPPVGSGPFPTKEADVKAIGWSNGRPLPSGAGYGLRISVSDRDRFFRPNWNTVSLEVEGGGKIVGRLSASFWKTCTELRSAEIGRWLLRQRLAPWQKGAPPSVEIDHVDGNRFRLRMPAG